MKMKLDVPKLAQGFAASAFVTILPVAGKPSMLMAPQVWWLFAVGVLASFFQPRYNPFGRSPDAKDRGTAKQIVWSVYVTQVAVLIEAAYFRYPASMEWNWITTVALVLILSGLWIRTWGVMTLGKYFTWHITAEKKQTVVRSGPYRFVRHPGYLGAFLTYSSTAVFFHAWTVLVPAAAILLFAFLRRIHYEEKELRATLGDEYKSYCRSVPRFVPGVW
ncbi:MAG: isoprenylcysteine carboxylmethyltransferase family protein [Kiritimatiellales bacterium]